MPDDSLIWTLRRMADGYMLDPGAGRLVLMLRIAADRIELLEDTVKKLQSKEATLWR
jgi:hypothetical protein